MALRIEYILLLVFTILIVSIFGFNPVSKEAVTSKGEREAEFKNFSVYNLKEDNTGREIHAQKAVKYKDYIDFMEVNLTDEMGHTLLSKKAIYKNNLLYLHENIKISRNDGIDFFTNDLMYNLKSKEIISEEDFLLEFNQSTIKGKRLEFNVGGKTISGYNVDASIWFVPQGEKSTKEE